MANVSQLVKFTSSASPLPINHLGKSHITKDERLLICRNAFAHFYLVWRMFTMWHAISHLTCCGRRSSKWRIDVLL